MDILLKYYPSLSAEQQRQYSSLYELYSDWNEKINVISRKDISNLYEHHVLHSLAISEVIHFTPGSCILDLGCGGGFPGIPLAIMFPEVSFHLVDSIGKKLKVAEAVSTAIGLKNVRFTHSRGEDLKGRDYDFVVSRAAMSLTDLVRCSRKNIRKDQHNVLPNGIIALKGGELAAEMNSMKSLCTTWDIKDFYDEDYCDQKKVVHVTIKN